MFPLPHALRDCQQSSHFGSRALHRNISSRCLAFPFPSQVLAGAACSPAFISSPSPPSSVFPPSPSGFIFRKCQQIDLYHIINPLLLPVTSAFRHISMSSLRARKRSLITAAAAAARYNVKFLKCKCILENYSPLDLPPPPPPLSHPQA